MSPSTATATRAYEDLRATAALVSLLRVPQSPLGQDPRSAVRARGTPAIVVTRSQELGELASLCRGASADSSSDPAQTLLIDSILSATAHEQILAALRPLGFGAMADRLAYLHAITGEEDPDEPPMAISSLRHCALFFASEPQHRDADIGVSPDGLLQAQWRLTGGGVLAVRFLPNGFLQFAGVSESGIPAERRRVHGTLPKDQALQAVRPFLPDSRF